MRFIPTCLNGVYMVELEPHVDARGFFARSFCTREFEAHGLMTYYVQCNVSRNSRRGTIRGLHYQIPPAGEVKLVRCTRGAVYDVAVDLRPDSPTLRRHIGVTLSAEQGNAIYIPEGFAHGFQTLEDHAEVFYQMGDFHTPQNATGLRYDDPALGVAWPIPVTSISEKDLGWPLLA
jgi:dTDP-4-dehydrorhamnose 3,5-epimerase